MGTAGIRGVDGNRIAPSEFLGTILVVFQQPIGAGASFTGIISEYGQNEKDTSHAMGPGCSLERVTGIEPALSAWKAGVLPLNYTRINALKARWSGRQDSNLRHPAPKAGALPNCATSRCYVLYYYNDFSAPCQRIQENFAHVPPRFPATGKDKLTSLHLDDNVNRVETLFYCNHTEYYLQEGSL